MTPSFNESLEPNDPLRRNAAPRIYLQPIAAPSILGLYAFAGATFMVAAHFAGWYGGPDTAMYLLPFVALFGGVAQFLAGMWAFKARDGLATAVHGTWGSFWMAFGLLYLLILDGKIGAPGILAPALGYWFIVLAAITCMCSVAAFGENVGFASVLVMLSVGSTLEAIARLIGNDGVHVAAGYAFVISAIIAWWVASAMMFEEAYGHPVIGAGKKKVRDTTVTTGMGEPGVIRGQ
ncbi:MAG TPA: acetate uptake transporter [Bryobacteraceae bacterium]|nr:acetate uptake transporter [Bryobacteraceae bacterium]